MSVALALLVVLAVVAPASAASLELTEPEKQQALRAGARSVTAEVFDAEWRVSNGAGESVMVLTPFHRLVIAARHAAFKNEPMKADEPDKVLRDQGKRVVLWASLQGPREDFARFYVPRLVVGDRQIKASFVQNERTAIRQDDGSFLARCVYAFSTDDLVGTSRIALVVTDADGREVRRFTIELAKMR